MVGETGPIRKSPAVLYCPSQTHPIHLFSTPDNPWPPEQQTSGYVRGGYSCRPGQGAIGGDKDWAWEGDNPPKKTKMPRFITLKNAAIFSDAMASMLRLDNGHRDGFNVLYATGNASWIDARGFKQTLMINLQDPFSNAYDPYVKQVWEEFDK
jgi:hypothetical protein